MKRHYLKSTMLQFLDVKDRKQFNTLQQLNTETISEWYTRILKYANQCNFDPNELEDRKS